MNLSKWHHFREPEFVFNRLKRIFRRGPAQSAQVGDWTPPANISGTANLMQAEMPEVKKEDIQAMFQNVMLTEHKHGKTGKKYRRVRSYGRIARSLQVPEGNAVAGYAAGVSMSDELDGQNHQQQIDAEGWRALAHLIRVQAHHSVDELPHEIGTHQIALGAHQIIALGEHQSALEKQIKELLQTQITLEESHEHYLELYEFAPVGYFTLTRDGMIAEVNHTGTTLLGVERKELLCHYFSQLIVSPGDRDRWSRFFVSALQHEARQSCELVLQRGDDSMFHAQLDCWHVEIGNDSSVCIALTDITGRKLDEEELRIAAIAFESQDGMIVTDPAGVILRVNRAFTRLTGYSEKETVGNTSAMFQSGRQDDAFYERMWDTLKRKHHWQGEMWNKRKNGKIYAEWLTISAVVAPDGCVTHYVGTFSEITKNKEAEAEIHRLAYYDPLTHLPNRRLLYDRLGQALASSKRNLRYGAILFLDLDNFKTLNDTLGHDVGDLLLTETAQRLIGAVREGDTIARLGGDEFVLLLEDLSADVQEAAIQASLVGNKVLEAIASPYLLKGAEFSCTTSIGVSMYFNHDKSVDELLKHADLAMYHAKKSGRNSLRFFDPTMQASLVERSALENDLHYALVRQEFRLYYQVQVNRERQVIGAEALIRWEHPERGLVSPDQFIPLAEETGSILPIGLWVLQTACAQIKAWSGNPATRDLQLAVNVSQRQFRQTDFVAQVQQVLENTGINPTRLKIELTESLALDNLSDTITKMRALIAKGISMAMDDFGTGYSSLTHLKQLPLDQLKIDQSFIRDLATDPNDAAIVQSIITMGRTFGLHVIAEGVETEAQLEFLDMHGCHSFQGYLFGRPVPVTEFEKLLVQYA